LDARALELATLARRRLAEPAIAGLAHGRVDDLDLAGRSQHQAEEPEHDAERGRQAERDRERIGGTAGDGPRADRVLDDEADHPAEHEAGGEPAELAPAAAMLPAGAFLLVQRSGRWLDVCGHARC